MKTSFFIAALLFLATATFSQNPTVKIKLDGEERFRFDSIQFIFVNSSHHVMIGDSVGMNNTANDTTVENTFLGFKAGAVNEDGWNTFLGARAGENHRGGNDNVYLGGWAGRYDSIGTFNTYVGANSGLYNKSGYSNTFLGRNTGIYSDSCSSNTLIGYNAGYYLAGGRYNVFLGRTTGGWSGVNGEVSYNTYLGSYAGYNNQDGENNVFIGYNAGRNELGSNRLHIANNDTTSLVYGEFDNRIVRFNANRVEIRNERENTFVGDSTGVSNEGVRNVFLGYHAGYSTTTSNDNIFIGDSAGYFTTTGRQNLFMGTWTGWSNTTGNSNVIMGYAAGIGMTEGSLNTMVGVNSGFYNTSGSENVFLGVSSGASNLTGSCNTYLGRRAGMHVQEGDSSVFIGYYAGAKEMASHRLYIANSDTTTPLLYGEFDNELLRIHGTLDIKGLYHFPVMDGTGGQVLKTDGSGTLSWSGDSGATNINGLSDGKVGGYSVFLGPGAGGNDDGSNRWNVAVGHTSLLDNVSGMYNTAVGGQALMNSTGSYNTATGYQALHNNTLAGYNTAHGAWALFNNTSGGYNNASGYGALYTNETGHFNTADGYKALYYNTASFNTAFGYQAMYANTWGEKNTAVGVGSLGNNTTGNYNVALGSNALYVNQEGHGNTAVGYAANCYNQNGSYNTILGYEAGRGSATHDKSGNVFIGYKAGYSEVGDNKLYIANSDTVAPLIYGDFESELLRIHGTLDVKGVYQFPVMDGVNGQVLQTDGSGNLGWASAGGDFSDGGEAGGAARTLGNTDNYSLGLKTYDTIRLHVTDLGKVGIGTTSPNGQFEVYKDDGAGTTAGDFVVDADNKKVYVGRLSSTPYNSTDFIVRNRFGYEPFVVSAANYISLGNYNGSHEQMRVVFDGVTYGVGVGTTTPTSKLDVSGSNGYEQFRMRNSYTPSGTSDANGNVGDVAWDDNFFYVKTSAGWKRAALSTF